MSYHNVYPSTAEELIQMLPDINDELDTIFPVLLQTAIANQPRCAVRITADPEGGYPESEVAIPLDNSLSLASQVMNADNTHGAYSVQLGRPATTLRSAESILSDMGDTEPLRVFGLGKFVVDGVVRSPLCMQTPALYTPDSNGTPRLYYLSDYDIQRGVPITEHRPPTIRPEALPHGGRRVFEEYGPFGAAKYEIEQEITLLRNVAESYS